MTRDPDLKVTTAMSSPAVMQVFLCEMLRAAEHPVDEDGRPPTWPESGNWSVQGDALMRHYRLWNGHGAERDTDGGCHHLAHLAAIAMRLWMLEMTHSGLDDRPATRAIQLLQQLAGNDPATA